MHIESPRIKKAQQGFTLIEMIVSIFIFSIVMVIATGSLVTILGANRKAQAVKTVMNNLNFALDSMTRAIRVGTDYDCGVPSCDTSGSTEFSFVDTDGDKILYRLNESTSRIERSVNGGSFSTLTSPGVTVERLMFYADGESESDAKQPRVLIIVGGEAGEGKSRTRFDLETLISQRILDR
jgi:prepilin-type N-terminal cleavage/methylation domain-containing protein